MKLETLKAKQTRGDKKMSVSKKPARVAANIAAPKRGVANKVVSKVAVSNKKRHKLIQNEAYFLAEKTGFSESAFDNWIQAEKNIDE